MASVPLRPADHWRSKSAAPVRTDCSTSRAALSTLSFILRSSSSSIERLTSAFTSLTYLWALPSSVPTVRATRGSFSGPMTISATAPMRAIFEMPRSITACPLRRRRSRLVARLDVDGALVDRRRRAGHLACGRHRRFRRGAVSHAVLEALDGTAEIGAHVLQLLGAKHQHDDQQNDQPMPDGKRTHGQLLNE